MAGMAADPGARERMLVNFFYAHPVGHAIEALHYANGYHAADPELEIAVALNAATPIELASFCSFVSAAYAIQQPLLEPNPASLEGVPREWTWVVDDGRRHQADPARAVPGAARLLRGQRPPPASRSAGAPSPAGHRPRTSRTSRCGSISRLPHAPRRPRRWASATRRSR